MDTIRFKSNKPRPETGMELGVTFKFAAGLAPEAAASKLIAFFETVNDASSDLGSVWLNVYCAGLPEEWRERIQTALDNVSAPKHLKLVVDNDAAVSSDHTTGERK